ncbi:MAG: ABC-F family ATP-binding cassette domain-containing protein [Brevundimonas sp.]|uniref:ABC-F family ATP-binding cassette domain-containing protein n=1 Tax=Brevundimonas sp. TaxID=1871086 RepID=UPI00391B4645
MTLDSVAARTPDGNTLFDNLTLAFGRERTGLVGRNGVGKSTLMRLIAGTQPPAEGAASRAGTIGVLDQRYDPAPGEAVADTLGVARPLAVLRRVLAGEGSVSDMGEADWTLDDRLNEALAQVGLSGLDLHRRTASLSGGEQTRLRLAGLLLARPDLILLDEPTNHMDAEGRGLIAGVLERWEGGAVVVSHDRTLLGRVDRIVELSSLGAATYGGNWDLYTERKAAERAAAERELDTAERAASRVAQEAQREAEKKARRDAAGRRFAASGSMPRIDLGLRADRAQDTGGKARRLAERRQDQARIELEAARERVEQARLMRIPMPSTGLAPGKVVLELQDARFDFAAPAESGRAATVGPVSLRLTGPERVAITGPNGAGKTTLLKLMAGALEPTSGVVRRPVRAALLDQDAALLQPDETLIDAWRRLNPEGSSNDAHAALARFLFRNVEARRVAGSLSGGERLRAALACVMTGARPPQLLILDEPTNHLDLDSVAAVEAALTAYDGALAVVSHDLLFLEKIGVTRAVTLPLAAA